jgi:toxin ParE1/3/4
MSAYRVLDTASDQIDQIYRYTLDNWGEAQANLYIHGLFDRFEAIAARRFPWRPIPAEFGIDGHVCRYEKHLIYWKLLADGAIGIVAVLHERMHQIERFQDSFRA